MLGKSLLIDSACEKLESRFNEDGVFPELDDFVHNVISDAEPELPNLKLGAFKEDLTVELLCTMVSLDEQSAFRILRQQFPSLVNRVESELQKGSSDNIVSGDRPLESRLADDGFEPNTGQTVDVYTLTEHLGKGGMGTVWKAIQSDPVQREVAIKFIRAWETSPAMLSRFKTEQQSLAILKHPNIAQIFDAGSTDGGNPYCVMELVEGQNLIDHAATAKLKVRERVALFLDVCRAIQHAHQNGIIHRDIKPSNIVVAMHENRDCPKVIDFGLAKVDRPGGMANASAETGSLHSSLTVEGQVLGTPDYMSPEQTSLGSSSSMSNVDTRTDIYSLGAVLYELLTGSRPFAEHRLREVSLESAVEVVRHENPIPFRKRNVEASSAGSSLSRELEWITMKCLEKNRDRRYDTVAQLADDLQRFLDGEAVEAAPPSRVYRFGKFVGKNKGLVASAAAVFLALSVGLVATATALNWAWTEQARANRESDQKSEALAKLELAQSETLKRAKELENVSMFQANQIQQIDPVMMGVSIRQKILENWRSAKATSRGDDDESRDGQAELDRLDQLDEGLSKTNFTDLAIDSLSQVYFQPALKTIQDQFADQPAIKAQLLNSLGQALNEQGAFDLAKVTLKLALEAWDDQVGTDDIRYWNCLSDLAATDSGKGNNKAAIDKLEKVVLACDRLALGDDPFAMKVRLRLGSAIRLIGKTVPAEEQLQMVVKWLDKHPEAPVRFRLQAIDELGITLAESGKLSEAIKLMYETLQSVDQSEPSIQKGLVLFQLHFAAAMEKAAKTRTLLQYELSELIKDVPDVSLPGETEKYIRSALALSKKVNGTEHPITLEAHNQLGIYLMYWRDWSVGVPFFEESLEMHKRILGKNHPQTLSVIGNLGVGHFHLKQYDKAILRLRESLAGLEKILEPDDTALLTAKSGIGVNLRRKGDLEEAYKILEDVYLRGRRDANFDFFRTEFLATCLEAKKYDRIVELAQEQYKLSGERYEPGSFDQCNDMVFAWSALMRIGKWKEAEPILKASLDIMEKLKPGAWQTHDHRATYGECLVKLERYDEAEEFLLSGQKGLEETFDEMPDGMKGKFGFSLERLVELYKATDDKSSLENWQRSLAEFQAKMKRHPAWQ